MLLKLNAYNVTTTSGWTNFKFNATGDVATAIIDRETTLATDIALSYTGTLWTPGSSSALTDQDHHGIEKNVWNNYNQLAIASSGTGTLKGFDIEIGEQWEFQFAAAAANSPARNTTITINGVAGTYVNVPQSTPMTPAAPIRVVATAVDDGSGRGKFDMTFAGTSVNKYITLITATNTPNIYSVNGDDAVKLGQTITWDVALLTPTTASIGGVGLNSVTATTGIIPALADGATVPDYNSESLVLSDGVDSPSRVVYVYPPDGYHYTRIMDINNSGDGYLKKYITALALDDVITMQDGDQLDPPVLVNGVDFDGRIVTDYIGTQTIYHRSFSTGFVTAYDLITESTGGIGLTISGLTTSGLTVSGLSVSGL